MEFELAYFEAAVQHYSHNTTRKPSLPDDPKIVKFKIVCRVYFFLLILLYII